MYIIHIKHFKKLLKCFPKWLHDFSLAPAMYASSDGSLSSPTLVLLSLSDSNQPSGDEVVISSFQDEINRFSYAVSIKSELRLGNFMYMYITNEHFMSKIYIDIYIDRCYIKSRIIIIISLYKTVKK